MGLLRGTHFPDLMRKDKKVVGRTSPAKPIEIVAAQGSRVRDREGREYIDWQMGSGVGNLGWNLPDIIARVRSFEGPSYVAPPMLYEPWADLAEQLVDITPGKLAKVYRCVGGTEAVELALQLAVAATGRHKFIALDESYHGNSIAVKSVAGEGMPAHLPGCKHLTPPLDDSALSHLETLLKNDEIAALIMEPVVMNLNVLVPSAEFMREVVELCHSHGALVIADEVMSGFGRAGTMFASELFDFSPDIMCLAKSITNGTVPLGATLCTNDVAKAAADSEVDFDFYSSFGWHPLGTEAALATLQYWREHKRELLQNTLERSQEIRHALSIMELPNEAEIRVQGLAVALELGDEERVSRVEQRCREDGLLLLAEEDALLMLPALTIDHETTQEALSILGQALQST